MVKKMHVKQMVTRRRWRNEIKGKETVVLMTVTTVAMKGAKV